MQRPIGVTVLAILAFVFGILLILGSVLVAALSAFIPELIKIYGIPVIVGGLDVSSFIQVFLIAIAVFAAVLGILHIVAAYGIWIGAGWGWVLAVVVVILNIIWSLLTLPNGIVGLVINAVILWYLMQPYVKAFFGKAPAPTSPPVPPV